jgi:hypothetical protein
MYRESCWSIDLAVVEAEGGRHAHGGVAGADMIARVVAVVAVHAEPAERPHRARDLHALLFQRDDRAVVVLAALHGVDAQREQLVAVIEVRGGAVGALGVEAVRELGELLAEAGALRVDVDHAAGVAGAKEQRVGALQRLGALDIEGVHQRGVGAQEAVAPRVADGEAAAGHGLVIHGVALLQAALILRAGAEDRGAEAAEDGEHRGDVDDIELIHHGAVEDARIEGRLVQRRAGAGDGIGVGRVVTVGGVDRDLEGRQHDSLLRGGGRPGRGGGGRLGPPGVGHGGEHRQQGDSPRPGGAEALADPERRGGGDGAHGRDWQPASPRRDRTTPAALDS